MSSIATPSVKQSLLPPPSVISSDNPTTSTFSASPPSISLESDQVSIKHRFETKSQHIDVFFLHMDSKLGSDLTGHYAESFTGKAFTRIIPPYKCQQKKHTSLPASPANTTKTALTNPKHSLDNDKLASSNTTIYTTPDSHDYLQDNVTIKWQRTTSLTKWNMPTPRSSCWISPEDEFGSTLFLAIDEELEVEEGHTWDVFRGGMLICNNESDGFQPVVFKITKFKSFRESIPEKPTDWNPDLDPVRTTVIDKVLNEDFILRQYLVGLQGDLVPYYHGMFVWHEEDDKDDENWIVAMVMEDVGDAMENNVFKYPLEMR
ncbi:uncharacterized protein L201_006073 [Kwoniella dendrophila CBS 6074]|uniref:Uncharacterized protein n=1 Tax=Kwoniella dendrophila CBS 6074 TaxID=1295534 RepID=A0AAX4K0Q8_9TREE